jgi:hypothetical protein
MATPHLVSIPLPTLSALPRPLYANLINRPNGRGNRYILFPHSTTRPDYRRPYALAFRKTAFQNTAYQNYQERARRKPVKLPLKYGSSQ